MKVEGHTEVFCEDLNMCIEVNDNIVKEWRDWIVGVVCKLKQIYFYLFKAKPIYTIT